MVFSFSLTRLLVQCLGAGDVADDIQADLVLLSTEAVHAKHVDANQLVREAQSASLQLSELPMTRFG